eukprot:9068840-Pyramimonas_sp.AAC.2
MPQMWLALSTRSIGCTSRCIAKRRVKLRPNTVTHTHTHTHRVSHRITPPRGVCCLGLDMDICRP